MKIERYASATVVEIGGVDGFEEAVCAGIFGVGEGGVEACVCCGAGEGFA